MPVPSLAGRLRAGEALLSAWCGIPEPVVAGILARENFDAVTLDMQHGAIDLSAVIRAVPLIAAAGKPALARIPVGDFATASKLLDSGVSAIIAPMINTIEDARRLAAFAKFPPLGERSWGPHGALALTGLSPSDYFAKANDLTLSLAMVETREALAILDDILAVPGIDGVFIGPADLSIALTGGARMDPLIREVEEALDHTLARARAAGKIAAVYAHTGERAGELIAKGYSFCAMGSDTVLLRAGAQALLKSAGR